MDATALLEAIRVSLMLEHIDQALEKMAECPDDPEMVKLLSRELLRTYEMDPS